MVLMLAISLSISVTPPFPLVSFVFPDFDHLSILPRMAICTDRPFPLPFHLASCTSHRSLASSFNCATISLISLIHAPFDAKQSQCRVIVASRSGSLYESARSSARSSAGKMKVLRWHIRQETTREGKELQRIAKRI